jgi:hypothetical protein
MDGGRYQGREKDAGTGSRWHEEKVLTVSSLSARGWQGP